MRRDIYPLYNLDLKPLSSVFDNFDSETHEHIMLNSRLWEKYYGNNLLYSNGSLVPHTSDLRLFKVQRYFGLDFYSRDKIYPVPDENNSFDSFIRVEFEGDSVKILPFLISQDGNPSPYLSFDGLFGAFYRKPFFSMEGSRKELEARIDFFNSITGEVFTRLDEIRSMGEIQFIRELAGESKEDLQKKLLCFRRFYDSGEGEKISKYLFRKEGGRVINYLNSSFHKS